MIRIENLKKTYDRGRRHENEVLHGVSLNLPDTGFICILGPSGCGKTSLLNAIGGLDSFDSGTLEINGKRINDMTYGQICRMRRSDTAFVFQGYNLISSMTARENVELGLKYRNIPRSRRTAMALKALEQVGLGHRTQHLPHQLSGGQQQRVAIARALVLEPKVLFCDEPTGNLDKQSAALVLDKICQLKQNGTAVVMITHDLSLLTMADKAYTLADGKLYRL